jgi:virulence factor BrkB
VTWGSVVAATLWVGGSLLLSWYVANFETYNTTYGSLHDLDVALDHRHPVGRRNQRGDGTPDRK